MKVVKRKMKIFAESRLSKKAEQDALRTEFEAAAHELIDDVKYGRVHKIEGKSCVEILKMKGAL